MPTLIEYRDVRVEGDDVSGTRQDQSPGQLDRGAGLVTGMHHFDAMLGGFPRE